MTERRRNIEQERAYNAMMIELDQLDAWLRNDKLKQRLIPADWHRIEREVPVRRRKTMLTARYDSDLVKWFRGLGEGYQSRMNAVLRAFMLAVVSKEILSRDDRDWKGEEIWGVAAKKAT